MAVVLAIVDAVTCGLWTAEVAMNVVVTVGMTGSNRGSGREGSGGLGLSAGRARGTIPRLTLLIGRP